MEEGITIVPSQAEPKGLTARYKPNGLYDKLLAFLAANNSRGYLDDDFLSLDGVTVGDLLSMATERNQLTEREIKRVAKRMRRATGGAIPHQKGLDMMAALFGYKDWNQAKSEFDRRGLLQNRRSSNGLGYTHALLKE